MCGKTGSLQMVEGLPVCYDCIRDSGMFSRCAVCGTWHVTERMAGTEGRKVCPACARLPRGLAIESWRTLNTEDAIGVEIECFPRERGSVGNNMRNHPESAPFINLTHDGSVTGGEEIVSQPIPMVSVPEFFASISWMARELKVDQTCGLHVHVNAKQYVRTTGLNPATLPEIGEAFKKWTLGFMKIEQFMFECQPSSRRHGRFCQAFSARYGSKTYADLRGMKGADVLKLWYSRGYAQGPRARREIPTNKYHESRYTWINLHSLISHGTVEVRVHSGTTNPMKMRIWASICNKLVKHFFGATYDELDAFNVESMKLILTRTEWEYLQNRKAKFSAPVAPIDETQARVSTVGAETRSVQ